MGKKKLLILIPARFGSTRFPGKPLTLLNRKPMIEWVVTHMGQNQDLDFEVTPCVVTDDDRIENHVKSIGANVVRVDDDVISGTLRIELAYDRFFAKDNYDLVINVQGDEPLLKIEHVLKLANYHLNQSQIDIGTMVKRRLGFNADFRDPNKVKALFCEGNGQCLYFSRQAIPYSRDLPEDAFGIWFLHIGVYSFLPKALKKFSQLPLGRYEDLEKLEQLKAMEFGMRIGAIEMNDDLMGVDHPHDVQKVEEVLSGRF